MRQYYKIANKDGFDQYTGYTINYRNNIGKTVKCPDKSKTYELCTSTVIHASESFCDALLYTKVWPISIFLVQGKPVAEKPEKAGFKEFIVKKEISISNWKQAYIDFMIWMLKGLKKNFDTKKYDKVTKAIDKTIKVFTDAKKTGKIKESAALSAVQSADLAADSAADLATDSATRSALSALSAAESAFSAAESAWSAAQLAVSASESAQSAALSVTWSAAWSAWSAAETSESALSAKKKELSDKFIEFLTGEVKTK